KTATDDRYAVPTAAALASLASTTCGHPIDSVKSRMQTFRYNGIADCVVRTYKAEKLGGFFRGLAAPLVTTTFARTISFSIYSRMREAGIHPFFSGNVAGLTVALLAAPFEFTKISSQLSVLIRASSHAIPTQGAVTARQTTTWHEAKQIYRRFGLPGFWTGIHWQLIRDGIGTGVFFSSYVLVKRALQKHPEVPNSATSIAIAGGSCGIVAWVCVYPLDTLKARHQRNVLQGRQEAKVMPLNFRKLYRGCSVSIIRTGVINSINFSLFE
ncbi:mitochondrial carrier domain-containing protein, partial [Protomyces lactucae-debilis]